MKTLLSTILAGILISCASPKISEDSCNYNKVPIDSRGTSIISFKTNNQTIIDRGQVKIETIHDGAFRYYNESWGPTLYLYDGDELKARIINPTEVINWK